MGGRIAQVAGGFADVGQGVAHVAGAEVGVVGLFVVAHVLVGELLADQVEQLVKAGAGVAGHVVDLVLVFVGGGGGEQVGLHGVVNEAEVTAGFAVAVDAHGVAFDHRRGPFWDHGGVGAVGVLAGAEHIEVAQADGLEPEGAGKHVGVEFVDVFGDRIGRQRVADGLFDFGQARVVAIGGAGGGVGEAAHRFVLGGHQHIQEAIDVGLVGGNWVLNGARHGAQCGLVKNVICPLYGFAAVIQVADVAFHEAESGPLLLGDQGLDFVQVVLVAGGEVVQAHYCLVQFEQGFQQVGADEAGYAGD